MSPGPNYDNTWGAALIGLIAASILYGITTLQAYLYFTMYPNDGRNIKFLATSVWIIDTVSLALVCNGMYGYLITNMGDPLGRLKVNRSLDIDPALMGILAFLTHAYLGTRVWKVCSRNILLGFFLALLSLSALALAIAASILSFRFDFWLQRTALKPLALAGTVLVVTLDSLIALVLCVYLLKQKIESKDARKVVRRVLIFAINTGLASSAMSIVNVVTFISLPNTLVFLGSNFIFTKVYANALLANLNARESLRGKGHMKDGTLSLNLSALRTNLQDIIVYHEVPSDSESRPSETPISLSTLNRTEETLPKS